MVGWPVITLGDVTAGDVLDVACHHPPVVIVTEVGPASEPITVRRGDVCLQIVPVRLSWEATRPTASDTAAPGGHGAVRGRTWLSLSTQVTRLGSTRRHRRPPDRYSP
ncbi:hypothetical protein [Spirillospora sp. NPDC048819]|uniref:hypothetical protein n=1 Tax=Spirillospora sp. NPDC048819 TaxID=3155268 RepID=UPI0033C70CF4